MKRIKSFFRNTSGNLAVMLALVSVPLFGAAGMAIDYTRASNVKSQLQNAADSAALAAVVEYRMGTRRDQRAMAKNYFAENYNNDLNASFRVRLRDKGARVITQARVNVPTSLLGILGKNNISVDVMSEAKIGKARLQIALVLDATGSMASDQKLQIMQASAKSFVDNINPLGDPRGNLVEFALVPFTTVVKLDDAWSNRWWMDLNGIAPRDFEGCVWDRSADWDSTDAEPQRSKSETFYQASPAAYYGTQSCNRITEIEPLTDRRGLIKYRIDRIVADGATNTNIGMVWGLNVLQDTLPYNERDRGTKKIIILLTDGLNNTARITAEGGTAADMDQATLDTCARAKSSGIEIYSIRVVEGNANMLRSCASKADNFFDVARPSDLGDVFDVISERLWSGMIALTK